MKRFRKLSSITYSEEQPPRASVLMEILEMEPKEGISFEITFNWKQMGVKETYYGGQTQQSLDKEN